MAPEQQAALDAVRAGRRVPQVVDGRADVYGLGLLLYEALGGRLPPPPAPGRALRRANRAVSVGLADLVARCLAANPAGRYRSAGALAADLRRHLDDLPLRGVANRSLAESWRKWRSRRPLALALASLVLLSVGAVVYSRAHFGRLEAEAEGSQRDGLGQMRLGEYARAREAFQRGLALARDVPFRDGLARELSHQLRLADRAAAGQELHGIVERLRPLYGADELPPAQARALQRQCRSFWEQRGRIADRLLPQPAPALDEQVRTDMLDLAVLWTDLRVRAAGADAKGAARRQALDVLDEAEALFGRSCVLERERHDHAAALGLAPPPAASAEPGTPWEHYALGRALLRAGDLAGAEQHLQAGLSPQPQAPWPHFYHGKCAYQLGRYDDAAEDFTVCVVLDPGCAWCFYNRALAYTELGRAERDRPDLADRHRDRAERDCDRALELDPTLGAAALTRGMLRYERQRYDDAAADLRQALEGGAVPAVVHYDLALVELARGDRGAAREQLRQALRDDPAHKEARALLDRLQDQP
jgi:tetratricopeptide (TPR) repeat protein